MVELSGSFRHKRASTATTTRPQTATNKHLPLSNVPYFSSVTQQIRFQTSPSSQYSPQYSAMNNLRNAQVSQICRAGPCHLT